MLQMRSEDFSVQQSDLSPVVNVSICFFQGIDDQEADLIQFQWIDW